MLNRLCSVFTAPTAAQLRLKILLVLLLLAIYRIGWQVPVPMIDLEAAGELCKNMIR